MKHSWLLALPLVLALAGCSSSSEPDEADALPERAPTVYRYADVAEYIDDHGIDFAITSAAVDDALGDICAAVDLQPMDPKFRRQVLAGLEGAPAAPEATLSRAVRGCYATGHAERPQVDVSYTTTCTKKYAQVFVTGDSTEMTKTGYRFIADVSLRNDGNVPAVVMTRVTWQLVGGDNVGMTRIVERLEPGQRRRLGFTKPATLDQVQRMGAHQYGDRLCTVKATALQNRS